MSPNIHGPLYIMKILGKINRKANNQGGNYMTENLADKNNPISTNFIQNIINEDLN